MYIKRLKLENFRRIGGAELELAPGANLITGENAQGKTTVLEAISYLSTGRSFRTIKDREVIPFTTGDDSMGDKFAAVEARVSSAATGHKIRGAIGRQSKSFWVDDKALAKLGDLWGVLNVVVFLPSDNELVMGSPSLRRALIGSLLARSNRFDLFTMQRYAAALRQRNALFRAKGYIRPGEYDVHEELMAEHGARLLAARQRLIAQLSPIAQKYVRRLTGHADEFVLLHESGWPKSFGFSEDHFNESPAVLTQLKDHLKQIWSETRVGDRERGRTENGPHRGDMALILNEQDARSFASQGQARTLVLALRLAEMELLQDLTGEAPILLLDDVLGELDQRRTLEFIRVMSESGMQSLLTATDARTVEGEMPIMARFEVKAGEVRRV